MAGARSARTATAVISFHRMGCAAVDRCRPPDSACCAGLYSCSAAVSYRRCSDYAMDGPPANTTLVGRGWAGLCSGRAGCVSGLVGICEEARDVAG